MKIALVAHSIDHRGGMERYMAELATRLKREHEVYLFAVTVDDIDREGLVVQRIPVVARPFLAKFASFYAAASGLLRRYDFDVVHTNGGIVASQNVVTAHTCQPAWGDALARLDPSTLSPARRLNRALTWRVAAGFERRAVRGWRAARVIAVSNRVADDLVRYYRVERRRLVTVYNGVDLDTFRPGDPAETRERLLRAHGLAPERVTFLFVGDFVRKGLATIIPALARAPDAQLLVVGRGDQVRFGHLARDTGVADRVAFAGTRTPIVPYYGTADAFVLPAFYEPFGMVITEAMASGLPVVISRVAGAAELIQDGVNGYLLDDPGDSTALGQVLAGLATDAELRRRVGRQARATVERYSWDWMYDRTLEVYETAVQAPSGSPAPRPNRQVLR